MRNVLLVSGTIVVVAALVAAAQPPSQDGEWPAYGRDHGGQRASPLDTITRENVSRLAVAWTFRTGDAYTPAEGRPTAFEATPLYIDGTLYLSTPLGRVLALDPVTGRPKWTFDGKVPRDKGYGDFASRGVSTWGRGPERRIYVATIDARLIALDAASGKPIATFGEQGTVDLRDHGVLELGSGLRQVRAGDLDIDDALSLGLRSSHRARSDEHAGR